MSGILLLLLSPLVLSQNIYGSHPSLPSQSYSYSSFHPQTASGPYHPQPATKSYHPQVASKPYRPQVFPKPYHPHAVSKPSAGIVHRPFQRAFLNSPAVGVSGSSDIIQHTRAQAESLKRDLRAMASNPRATQTLQRVFADGNNACINNMEDALIAVESSTKLFENAGAELTQLVSSVKIFETSIDTPRAVRETANILRLLDVLIPKLTPTSPSTCRATSYDEFASLRSLSVLIDELSNKDDLYFNAHKRQSLKSSAKIIVKVTNFLTQLKRTFSKFDQFCTSDKSYNIEVITAIGNLMTELADLYSSLGGVTAAVEISKQTDFTGKVVANLRKLGNVNLITPDCSTPKSSLYIANNLDDLATLIEEVGMENLCIQLDLGLDCTF